MAATSMIVLCLLVAVFVRYVYQGVPLRVERTLSDLLFALREQPSEWHTMYYPKTITKAGSHYAAKKDGCCGFVRKLGFREEFTGVLDVFRGASSCVSVSAGWFVGYWNARLEVEREDDNHLRVRVVSCEHSLEYAEPNMDFVFGKCAILGQESGDGNWVELQVSPYVGCRIRYEEYKELEIRTGKKPNMGYMEYMSKDLDVERVDIPRIAVALKEELDTLKFEPWVQPASSGEDDGDIEAVLLCKDNDVDLERLRPAGKILPAPCDHDSLVYHVNKSSEAISFQERIAKYVDDTYAPPPIYKDRLNEFLQLLIPESEKHTLVPEDLEEVLDRQKRRSQVTGWEDVKDIPDVLTVEEDKSFLKGEAYPEFKPPRNITNPNHGKRVLTATIVGPLQRHLKANSLKHVYGFGDADYVRACFEKVHRMDTGKGKYEIDVSKMDANLIKFFRELEVKLLLRAYGELYEDTCVNIHEAQYNNAAVIRGKHGNVVYMGYSRRSGEGGTSLFNTVAGVFVAYCWLKSLGQKPAEAFANLGVYGGDDALSVAWGDVKSLKKIGEDLHLPLKVIHRKTHEPFSFLGLTRMGKAEIFAPDVVRFTSKIAYSHVKGVPVEELLYRKCEPYVRMYPSVPLVGNLCRAVLRVLRKKGFTVQTKYDELCRSGQGYVMSMLEGAQMPQPETDEEVEILYSYVAETLGISLGVLRRVCKMYDDAEDFSQFPQGYIKVDNIYLNCEYEALIRDLYIPGPTVSKFVNNLPTESDKSAVQNPPEQPTSKDEAKSIKSSEASSVKSASSSSVKTSGSKAKKRRKKDSHKPAS
jgi:hypothetical protein